MRSWVAGPGRRIDAPPGHAALSWLPGGLVAFCGGRRPILPRQNLHKMGASAKALMKRWRFLHFQPAIRPSAYAPLEAPGRPPASPTPLPPSLTRRQRIDSLRTGPLAYWKRSGLCRSPIPRRNHGGRRHHDDGPQWPGARRVRRAQGQTQIASSNATGGDGFGDAGAAGQGGAAVRRRRDRGHRRRLPLWRDADVVDRRRPGAALCEVQGRGAERAACRSP